MSEQPTESQLGLAWQGSRLQLAVTTLTGELRESHLLESTGSISADLDAALSLAPKGLRAIMIATDRMRAALGGNEPLARVGTLRVGGPVTEGVPVLASWPDELIERISPITAIVDGSFDSAGNELSPFDEASAERFFEQCAGTVDAIAISGVFALLAPEFERRAASIAKRVLGESMSVTMSHAVAGLGLLDRENAATLSAALTPIAAEMLREIDATIAARSLEVEVFFTQNDGTLAVAEIAAATPISMLEGVTAASISGAAAFAGVSDAIISGGVLSRPGIIRDGFVVVTSAPTWVAGARVNVELPVGAATSSAPGTSQPEPSQLRVEAEQARPTSPEHLEVAAAYGSAIAPVGATTWVVLEDGEHETYQLAHAKQQVTELAIMAGADPVTVSIADIDALDVSHVAKRRLRIRATGRPQFISRADRTAPDPTVNQSTQRKS